jgi:Domain of unknown function (DUF2017)
VARRGKAVKRTRSGDYELRLSAEERDLLRGLPPRMQEVLTDQTDPVLARLFPVAYPEDEERQAEYAVLVRDELLDSHVAALTTLEETVDAERLDEERLLAWMRALNQVRLVLGVRLEVTEEGDERPADPTDPRTAAFAIYDYLTWLQGEVIDALAR